MSMDRNKAPNDVVSFRAEEDGGATAWGLLLLVSMALLGGLAVDVSNVMTERTNLQVAADSAAHAALLKREFGSSNEAVAAAQANMERNLPAQAFGTTLRAEDVVFGRWDDETRQFTPEMSSRSAVKVTARMQEATGNPVKVFLLQFAGLDTWDVVADAVYVTYHPTCLKEGFVAEQPVDIQSNNSFQDGFCVHSNSYVSLNSNNYFEPGTVVSMPDLDDLELPNSGYKTNTGLKEALREGSWNIRIVSRIKGIIDGLLAFDSRYLPDYITSKVPVTLPSSTVTQANLVQGKLHRYSCSRGGSTLTIDKDVLMQQVVLVTDCEVKFSAGVALEDAVVATTNTSAKSISAPAQLRLGRADNCAPGGGVQIVTMGSVKVAADLNMNGVQIIAKDDIEFTANAVGIQGAALVAGGTISGTSNMSMGYCGSGMEDNFQAEYFKLVQ